MPDREDRDDEEHADRAAQIDARGAQGVAIGDNKSVVNHFYANSRTVRRTPRVWGLAAATAAAVVVALFATWNPHTPSRTLGRTWLAPPGGATQSEPFTTIDSAISLRAHVAPADQVDHINFTANWGAGRQSVCRVYHRPTSSGNTAGSCADTGTDPSQGIYGTTWDLRQAGVPVGALIQISFDIYGAHDEGAPENLAPNGIHWVKYVAAAPQGSTA